jgi:hypothetical protein
VGIALILTTPSGLPLSTYVWGLILAVGAWLLGLPGVVKAARLWTEFFAARREIRSARITQAEGTVVWAGGLYVAVAGRQHLKPIYNKLNLPPAHYRFFYLRNSHWLLSAERLSDLAAAETERNVLTILAKANRFTVSDLIANREGHFTTRQILRLWLTLTGRLGAVLLLSLIAALIIGSGLLSTRFDPIFLAFIEAMTFGFLAKIFGVFAVVVDLIRGHVAEVEGAGQRRKPQTRGERHAYHIGGLRFEVSGQGYNALIVGAIYRVYYAPHSKILLSIEPASISTMASS